jgi:hypothetical protein
VSCLFLLSKRLADLGRRSLVDTHVHLMYDSGPDLLMRAPQLVDEWRAIVRQYSRSREPIVRCGQLKLKAGVTTMRVLGMAMRSEP